LTSRSYETVPGRNFWRSVQRFQAWDNEQFKGTPITVPFQAALYCVSLQDNAGILAKVKFEFGGLRYVTTPDRFAIALGIVQPAPASQIKSGRFLGAVRSTLAVLGPLACRLDLMWRAARKKSARELPGQKRGRLSIGP